MLASCSGRKGPEGRYPLHYLVWHNRARDLDRELSAKQADIEQLDPRGRTPLHLATTLGHLECARVLLKHGADVGKENRSGWTVLQEAVSTRDLELVQLVLRYRDYQRAIKRLAGIPILLEKLRKAQDFYVEMKWEFTSWVPLVSKICPSDTYKVWKSGQNLRVDTTLLGFDHMTWQRGNRSFVFRGQDTSAVVMEIDHDRRVVYSETLALASHDQEVLLAAVQPTEEQVMGRLTAPVVTTQLDTKNIAFERNKSGILGWRSEKTEMVNGYEAKVYGASNVELITRTRTEHLSDQHKGKSKGSKTPLQSFLGIAEQHVGPNNGTLITQTLSHANPTAITPEEYFNPNFELGNRDMGRPMELTTKTQKETAVRCGVPPLPDAPMPPGNPRGLTFRGTVMTMGSHLRSCSLKNLRGAEVVRVCRPPPDPSASLQPPRGSHRAISHLLTSSPRLGMKPMPRCGSLLL
uniref:Ankyrin repeat domain 13B n=1 Tax=Calidris pygmaea TaxID=425635 RepID=A0A8C3JT60_9CHAR